MTKCHGTFTVDRETHLENRGFTRAMKEYGGNLMFNMQTMKLGRGDLANGKYNGIMMSRGVVDWHSHPARCLNKKTCAIGLPSPADLQNIMVGALYGTSAHLVYAKEGTYLIQVRASFLRKLHTYSSDAIRAHLQAIERTFETLHKHFVTTVTMKYKEYIKVWTKHARSYGFNVRLFAGDRVPSVCVYYDCHFTHRDHPFIPRIHIPANSFV
jgi:hypothetical protein